jgi:hypothetical protein
VTPHPHPTSCSSEEILASHQPLAPGYAPAAIRGREAVTHGGVVETRGRAEFSSASVTCRGAGSPSPVAATDATPASVHALPQLRCTRQRPVCVRGEGDGSGGGVRSAGCRPVAQQHRGCVARRQICSISTHPRRVGALLEAAFERCARPIRPWPPHIRAGSEMMAWNILRPIDRPGT